MKHILTTLFLTASALSYAGTTADIYGTAYDIDTLGHVQIGPGTMHTKLLFKSASKTFRAEVLTMEMKGHDNVEYRMEIGQDTTLSTERISSIAQRKSNANQHYFAAVNADFFITTSYVAQYAGEPHMDCIMNGEIASTGYLNAADYGHFFMDRNKNMWCDNPTQTFTITYPDGTIATLPRINEDIHDGETVLFNSKYGKQTRVSGCTDVQVALAEGESWGVNKPIKLIVTSAPTTAGATPISSGAAVLSALGGSGAEKIAALKEGDILTANFNITLQDYKVNPDIKECSGGDVVILKRGEIILEAIRFINSRDANNPRTMFGYDEDRSKMVWCAIDGRQSGYSDGCTYPEGAGVMKFLGCYDALNVDGGGSTGMYIEPFGIVNKPSDGNERAVANGIFAVLNAPEDNEIAEIQFKDWAITLPRYGIYTPVIYGYNKYGLLINTNVAATISAPEALGEIKDNGTTLFGNGSGTHALTATYNGLTANIAVTVDDANAPEFKYTNVLLDNYREWPVDVRALVNEEYMTIAPQALSWASNDDAIVTIDDTGIAKGVADGTATITGSVGDFNGDINITVECPTGPTMPIEKVVNADAWNATITATGVKDYNVTALEGEGMSINYTVASGRSRNLTLSRNDLKIWSLPDAIKLTINPGSAKISTLKITGKANNGSAKDYIISSVPQNTASEYEIPVSAFGDVNDIGIYPISLTGINIVLSGGTVGTTHNILFQKLEGVYNNAPSGIEGITTDNNDISNAPAEYYNLQGIKVIHPQNGFYIVKRGNSVTKEIIR